MESKRSAILRELQTPDEATLVFNSFGLGGRLGPEDAAEFQAATVARAVLAENVSEDVRNNFERTRKLHLYGVLEYEFFTAAGDYALLVLEGALRARFLAFYSDGIPLVCGETEELLLASTFEDVLAARRARLRGADGATYRLPLSADALLSWARREQLLAGTRAKIIEGVLSERQTTQPIPSGTRSTCRWTPLARSAMSPRRSTSYGATTRQAVASFPARRPASRGSPRWHQTATADAKCVSSKYPKPTSASAGGTTPSSLQERALSHFQPGGLTSEQRETIEALPTLRPQPWMCRGCGTDNEAGRTGCVECSVVGPELAKRVEELLREPT